ncbi:energy-dependent translational throttle protein EttA [Temperatibacter marinus]|uniref:Energy-dependent translational throttle protein EttA n=1 Tax=Temperatibacter marinus TaxID=1456591 RepID=A0AA52H9S2_9PROT|nr:energy-dependent translational throttle protein EttA [Temperatibacter marinus]WND01898.1 energy-dependent translational throttle protein EttA [Temperatibacter marinus]
MASFEFVYQMQNLTKTYPGGKTVLDNITLNFLPDAKIAVIGHNGAGKSTLMKIMAGIETEHGGDCWAGKGAKVGYLPQEPQLDGSLDVMGNVMLGLAETKALVDEFNQVAGDYGMDPENMDLLTKMGELQEEIDAKDAWDLESQAEVAMDALRCPPGEWDVDKLSGGEKRRVALCKLLLEKPDMLLLDEPTNHLDAETVAWLEQYLQNYNGCVILVTHDRYFLDNVVSWVLELDRGKGIPFEGNYSAWLEMKAKRMAQEERSEKSRQSAITRELEWIKQSPKARQAKSKARIKAYDELVNANKEAVAGTAQIKIQPPERLGAKVIELEGVTKGFGDKLLFDDLTFSLPPGGIVGVIGANGAGKTTLFKLITGEETPDAGSVDIGDTVQLGYVNQSRDALGGDNTVWQEISEGHDIFYFGKQEINTRAYVGSFNFKKGDQQKKVGQLSGGERNRVHLAKMLKEPANVLLLDEPTNDLDVETLAALEEALEVYAGCAVVISHDRFFLDRLATHILAFEGDSHVEWFEGNYEDYEKDRKRRLGDAAAQPHRIKYRKFER